MLKSERRILWFDSWESAFVGVTCLALLVPWVRSPHIEKNVTFSEVFLCVYACVEAEQSLMNSLGKSSLFMTKELGKSSCLLGLESHLPGHQN